VRQAFLLALLINSAIQKSHDNDTYHSMLISIQPEARSNQEIMGRSYGEFYRKGNIILRDFSTSATEQSVANPLFVKEAPPYDLDLLNRYIRDARLTNGYRRVFEAVKLGTTNSDNDEFIGPLRENWTKSLSENAVDIVGVIGMK
jgi:hypothetical protein